MCNAYRVFTEIEKAIKVKNIKLIIPNYKILKNILKNNKKKIINKLDKLGIENRPIIGGNFLKQPALKKYNLKQKSNNFPNANYVHEFGLFVGLKNNPLSNLETKRFINIFFKAFEI